MSENPLSFFTLHRTLRVPDSEGKTYQLPPSIGHFPLVACKDTAAPLAWANDYMFPMYNSEAMWMSFNDRGTPHAVIMTASGVNVVTGEIITDIDKMSLVAEPQNYMVVPSQPWIDGIKHADGKVRQFVGVSFASGKTLGQQVAGFKDDTIKLTFFPSKNPDKHRSFGMMRGMSLNSSCMAFACADSGGMESMSMGVGAGGEIEQKIYPDKYGINEWNPEQPVRFNIRIVNALMWEALTGKNPPYQPFTATDYQYHSFPWFKLYDEQKSDTKPSEVLAAIKSIYDGTEAPANTRPAIGIPSGH